MHTHGKFTYSERKICSQFTPTEIKNIVSKEVELVRSNLNIKVVLQYT